MHVMQMPHIILAGLSSDWKLLAMDKKKGNATVFKLLSPLCIFFLLLRCICHLCTLLLGEIILWPGCVDHFMAFSVQAYYEQRGMRGAKILAHFQHRDNNTFFEWESTICFEWCTLTTTTSTDVTCMHIWVSTISGLKLSWISLLNILLPNKNLN